MSANDVAEIAVDIALPVKKLLPQMVSDQNQGFISI